MNRLVVGLTGGIASGKSSLADMLEGLGAIVIDTDVISKELTAYGAEGAVLLERLFPNAFENGCLNRFALKQIIFNNKNARSLVNSTLHPLIAKRCTELIDKTIGIVVVVVPLLFETGFEKLTEKTVTVTCDENTRIQRLMKRDNIDIALAKAILLTQLSDSEREKRADFVVYNDCDLTHLRNSANELYEKLKQIYEC